MKTDTPYMTANEIRQSFLDFFKNKGHQIVPSAPVIPQNDPTLHFTNAGMNQFKDIFLGTRNRPYPRVADSQKCIRVSGKHNDLEEVGRDTYHHTFFEMLGNWSFGDYFKAESIHWAWELLTRVWQLPKERLYITVFEGNDSDGVEPDEEAIEEWKKQTDIDPSHIYRFGKKDNFWEMGETGPCGPCSEIHIDRGEGFCDKLHLPDHVCQVNGGCARFIELWNLVFIQFSRDETGKLNALPARHVDTGAGFERLVAVLQGKISNYDIDLFQPILEEIARITGIAYGAGEIGVAFRVLADHIRALTFAIADGAIPSNERQGYVLRRLLRRAARFGRVLGMREPFIFKLVKPLVDEMGDTYPEIRARQDYISRVIRSEEENFGRTLDRGIEIFEQKAKTALAKGDRIFSGSDTFLLHDTFGFPLDLTQLMAAEKDMTVDVATFEREMEQQRERSVKDRDTTYQSLEIISTEGDSFFTGYLFDEIESTILHCEEGKIVLKETPFYAESGGQVGDTGVIHNERFEFLVQDTQYVGEHILHLGRLIRGTNPRRGESVRAKIEAKKRRATERNHTVTHLLHKALRTVLGDHVHQAGSLVHPDYMRFDFTHFEKIPEERLMEIEQIVNQKILENLPVAWQIVPLEKAKKLGAMALFGEKYGDQVRMVEIQSYSRELCGGTHVRASGQIGEFIIISETAVAAGIRRIESLTGLKALEYARQKFTLLDQVSRAIACPPQEIGQRLAVLLDERKKLEAEIKKLRFDSSKDLINDLMVDMKQVNGVKVVAAKVDTKDVDELRRMGDLVRERLGSGIAVLATVLEEKITFICIVTKDLIQTKNLKAGELVKAVATIAGGSGGGAPHMALAGAKDISKLDLALDQVPEIVRQKIH